jgi:hypothetical protein
MKSQIDDYSVGETVEKDEHRAGFVDVDPVLVFCGESQLRA